MHNSTGKLLVQLQNNNQSGNLQPQQEIKLSNPSTVYFWSLFRFADRYDAILMIVGSISAAIVGGSMPVFALLWGDSTDAFGQGGDAMVKAALNTFLLFIYIGIGIFVAGILMFACWMITGQRQAIKCRQQYLKSLLRQQIGWFDLINQSELSSSFASDCFAFQGAVGQKVSSAILTIGSLVAGFVIAFVKGWLLALLMLATMPVLALTSALHLTAIKKFLEKKKQKYNQTCGRIQQSLSGIKTVKMLNGQNYEVERYQQALNQAMKGQNFGLIVTSIAVGVAFLSWFLAYAWGFWWGSKLIENKNSNPVSSTGLYSGGDVLVIFFSLVIAGFNLSQLSPAYTKIVQGITAAGRIFAIIDRQPMITNPENGIVIQNFRGKIKFENVTFRYPKQKAKKVLDSINLDFDLNNTALVGQSGCGKSTILQLIMRFYDPDEGRVTLDGVDLKTIDLKWLRSQLGYVGQQPVLFATTIKENLLFGKGDATDEEIIDALKKANAYNFIMKLQDKLETYVGYGGGQLSGGQKQRIAIARALLKKPKILLLDEATSALDRRNERKIQNTLDKVSKDITTVTVAHRIRTIMNANLICVMQYGKIIEKGTFSTLNRYKNEQIERQESISSGDDEQKKEQKRIKLPDINEGKISFYLGPKQELTDKQKQKQQEQKLKQKYGFCTVFSRLLSYTLRSIVDIVLFVFGIIVSMINGMVFPIFSIFLGQFIGVLLDLQTAARENRDTSSYRETANRDALLFVILGGVTFVCNVIQHFSFGYLGRNITGQIREQAYVKMLKMPIIWFDKPKNNAGTLAGRLAADCDLINGITTTFVSIGIQITTTLIGGLIIAFIFEWRITLVALGLIPLMILSGMVQVKVSMGFSDQSDEAYKDSSNIINQTVMNIRTVTSFGYDTFVVEQYSKRLEKPYRLAIKKGMISGFFMGLSQFILFFIFGILFYIGAIFVRDNYQNQQQGVKNVFVAIYAIVFAGMGVGNNAQFMPDIGAGQNAGANLFELIDSQDEDQMQIASNSKMLKQGLSGNITLQNVTFKYQSRNTNLFQHFNIKFQNSKKIALVGPSGCGKSTITQLLLRFYDLQNGKGKIILGDNEIKDYDIHYLRSCFGVVSQDPVLFNDSFRENIKYNTEATQQQIRQAAQKANAISFIEGNEQINANSSHNTEQNETGFERKVGVKGSHISGGQKQRVAIARAILRKPMILLLDEATSALDSSNEKIVQDSLDKIMKDKTTISIAHRIETIKNSDLIYVFQQGKIVQEGSYSQLLAKQGYFYNLERGTQFV